MACVFFGLGTQLQIFGQPTDETFAFDEPESWAMKYFASVGLMNGYGPQDKLKFGKFQLRGELANIPHLNKMKRTVGFGGTKEENLNKAPLLFRPTVTMGLTESISASVSWVPPIEVFDRLETNMLGFSFNARLLEKNTYAVGVRIFGQYNKATGDFTCGDDIAGKGDDVNPFGCIEPSNDTFITENYGVELSVAKEISFLKNTSIFAGFSYQKMDLEFQVRALRSDVQDMRSLFTDGSTHSYTLGLRKKVKENISLSGSIFYSPLDVRRTQGASVQNDGLFNFRFAVDYNL